VPPSKAGIHYSPGEAAARIQACHSRPRPKGHGRLHDPPHDLSLNDVNMNSVVEPGRFDLMVGPKFGENLERRARSGKPVVSIGRSCMRA